MLSAHSGEGARNWDRERNSVLKEFSVANLE